MNTIAMKWAVALLAVALVGCPGNDKEEPEPNRLEGIMTGTATRGGVDRPVIAVASGGRLLAVEFDPDGTPSTDSFFFDGTYAITNGSLTANNVRVYGTGTTKPFLRQYKESGNMTGTATTEEWILSLPAASGTTTFELVHDPADRANSSLSFLTGTWHYEQGTDTSTLTILSNGASSTVNSSGCETDGSVALINANYNVYGVSTQLTSPGTPSCPAVLAGDYTGFLMLDVAANPDGALVFASKRTTPASTSDFMAAYVSYERQ